MKLLARLFGFAFRAIDCAFFILVPFGQHQAEHDAVLKWIRERETFRVVFLVAEHQRADREQAVEPATCLVDGFTDEVRRKLRFEFLGLSVGEAKLSEWHRTGIEPTVDDFRDAFHFRTGSKRRVIRDRVDVWLVYSQIVGQVGVRSFRFVPNVGALDARLCQEFLVAGNGFHLSCLLANPNRQRSSPISFPRESPVNVRRQEVSKASVFYMVRQPIDLLVVRDHLVFKLSRFHEPAATWILDQRILVSSPAEWIVVQILIEQQQPPAFSDLTSQIFICFLNPASFIWSCFVGELAVGTDSADQLGAVRFEAFLLRHQQFVINLAECRSDMHNARSAIGRDEVRWTNVPSDVCFLAGFRRALSIAEVFVVIIKRRNVSFADEVSALQF